MIAAGGNGLAQMVIALCAAVIGLFFIGFNKQAATKLIEQESAKPRRAKLYTQPWVMSAVRLTFVIVGLVVLISAIVALARQHHASRRRPERGGGGVLFVSVSTAT